MLPTDQADNALVTVSISFGNAEEAAAVARELVDRRLAACAQFWPMRSVYRWEGQVEEAEEYMLAAKTVAGLLPDIDALVRGRHTYEVPEIIAHPMLWASEPYARWVQESVSPKGAGAAKGEA